MLSAKSQAKYIFIVFSVTFVYCLSACVFRKKEEALKKSTSEKDSLQKEATKWRIAHDKLQKESDTRAQGQM